MSGTNPWDNSEAARSSESISSSTYSGSSLHTATAVGVQPARPAAVQVRPNSQLQNDRARPSTALSSDPSNPLHVARVRLANEHATEIMDRDRRQMRRLSGPTNPYPARLATPPSIPPLPEAQRNFLMPTYSQQAWQQPATTQVRDFASPHEVAQTIGNSTPSKADVKAQKQIEKNERIQKEITAKLNKEREKDQIKREKKREKEQRER
ncbi:hypothetical protein ACLMJK_007720 [Lecanora helva]